jgi:beta-N-acetylhexosaminidase
LGLLFVNLLAPQALWAQGASPLLAPTTTLTTSAPVDAAQLAEQAINEHIAAVFAAMSPADRVGQLFVITFDGNQISRNSDIVELIYRERVGGVILSPVKHNFTNTKGEDTPTLVARLTNQLQALTYGRMVQPQQALSLPLTSSLPFSGSVALSPIIAPAVPLLIGVEQLGDGYPKSALRRGFTTLPSQMALGATWDPTLVQSVGAIVGQELQAVGINLLLGPNLDVVDETRAAPVGALGLCSFGGDPYWVSQLGRAYIAGVHMGSANRVAAIARHFPGQGDIDRFPDLEVATVQKSPDELHDLALPPFRTVTRQVSPILTVDGDLAAADGLMTSHMRFSALQGLTPGRTTPVSLNPELKLFITNQGLGDWYNAGGVMMTNNLGLPAIRSYYEATVGEFSYKRVALDAFVAGHDLLYLAHQGTNNSWHTEKAYLKEVLQFFRDRYEGDPEFRAQVDQAVQRILRLKLGLYQPPMAQQSGEAIALPALPPQMLAPPAQVLRRASDLALFAEGSKHRTAAADIISQVTRAAVTLLYPDVENLSEVIANPPQAKDQLLIFSDSRLFSECEGCLVETALGPEELKAIITRLYGSEPGATGQIDAERIYGRSFVELATLLDATDTANLTTAAITTTATVTTVQGIAAPVNDALADDGAAAPEDTLSPNERLQRLINDSKWIIFAMLDVDPENQSGSDVVKRFLRQQSEQLGDKQVIVLALNAPYFLDATEISKLTAYFGVYSKTQPFLESAIRALFRSATPPGAPPVSVPGTRFDNLAARLQADPQRLPTLTLAVGENATPLPVMADGADPVIGVGDTLRLAVSNILDYNGHLVPDGLPVEFELVDEARNITIPIEPTTTRNGNANQEVIITTPGRLLISVSVGAAKTTPPLVVRIQEPTVAPVAANVVPTTPITMTLQNTPSVTVAVTAPVTAPIAANPANIPLATDQLTEASVNPGTLIVAFLTILVTLSFLLILQIHILPRSMLMQNMLWAAIFGLSAYILYGLGILPGVGFLRETLRVWGAAVVVFIGMLLPLLWLQLRAE